MGPVKRQPRFKRDRGPLNLGALTWRVREGYARGRRGRLVSADRTESTWSWSKSVPTNFLFARRQRTTRQAKELLHKMGRGVVDAISEFEQHHPDEIAVEGAKLSDAQRELERSYSAGHGLSGLATDRTLMLHCASNSTWVMARKRCTSIVMVAPISLGQKFHRRVFVSEPAMKLVAERDGRS